MKLISDSVKRTLQKELQEVFQDTTVSVVADFTTHYMGEEKMSSKDLVFVLTCGNASISNDDIKIITCPITLTCVCPITYKNKNKVAQKLHDWFETYSIGKTIMNFRDNTHGFTEYYGYFDVLTPYVAGNVRNFASQKCTDITISGNVMLCQTEFKFDAMPKINIDNKELKNVISCNRKVTISTNNYTVLGNDRQKKIKDFVTNTYTIQFIYDSNNELHVDLLLGSYKLSHYFRIEYKVLNDTEGYLENPDMLYVDSDITFEKNAFNIATLTIVF